MEIKNDPPIQTTHTSLVADGSENHFGSHDSQRNVLNEIPFQVPQDSDLDSMYEAHDTASPYHLGATLRPDNRNFLDVDDSMTPISHSSDDFADIDGVSSPTQNRRYDNLRQNKIDPTSCSVGAQRVSERSYLCIIFIVMLNVVALIFSSLMLCLTLRYLNAFRSEINKQHTETFFHLLQSVKPLNSSIIASLTLNLLCLIVYVLALLIVAVFYYHRRNNSRVRSFSEKNETDHILNFFVLRESNACTQATGSNPKFHSNPPPPPGPTHPLAWTSGVNSIISPASLQDAGAWPTSRSGVTVTCSSNPEQTITSAQGCMPTHHCDHSSSQKSQLELSANRSGTTHQHHQHSLGQRAETVGGSDGSGFSPSLYHSLHTQGQEQSQAQHDQHQPQPQQHRLLHESTGRFAEGDTAGCPSLQAPSHPGAEGTRRSGRDDLQLPNLKNIHSNFVAFTDVSPGTILTPITAPLNYDPFGSNRTYPTVDRRLVLRIQSCSFCPNDILRSVGSLPLICNKAVVTGNVSDIVMALVSYACDSTNAVVASLSSCSATLTWNPDELTECSTREIFGLIEYIHEHIKGVCVAAVSLGTFLISPVWDTGLIAVGGTECVNLERLAMLLTISSSSYCATEPSMNHEFSGGGHISNDRDALSMTSRQYDEESSPGSMHMQHSSRLSRLFHCDDEVSVLITASAITLFRDMDQRFEFMNVGEVTFDPTYSAVCSSPNTTQTFVHVYTLCPVVDPNTTQGSIPQSLYFVSLDLGWQTVVEGAREHGDQTGTSRNNVRSLSMYYNLCCFRDQITGVLDRVKMSRRPPGAIRVVSCVLPKNAPLRNDSGTTSKARRFASVIRPKQQNVNKGDGLQGALDISNILEQDSEVPFVHTSYQAQDDDDDDDDDDEDSIENVENQEAHMLLIHDFNGREYRVSRSAVLGRGTNGVVVRGLGSKGNLVAVKIVTVGEDKERAEAIVKEVEVLSSLRHTNVLRYITVTLQGEGRRRCAYVFTQFVSGGTLDYFYQNFGPFPIDLLRRYLCDIVRGLAHVHAMNLIHSDIKPQNILVDASGRCVLGDFGAALDTMPSTNSRRPRGEIQGSPLFMAPEHARGNPTQESDMWSFGVTALYLATGDVLFPSRHGLSSAGPRSHMELGAFLYQLGKHDNMVPIVPWLELDPCICEVLRVTLVRDPADRATASKVLEILGERDEMLVSMERSMRSMAFSVNTSSGFLTSGAAVDTSPSRRGHRRI